MVVCMYVLPTMYGIIHGMRTYTRDGIPSSTAESV